MSHTDLWYNAEFYDSMQLIGITQKTDEKSHPFVLFAVVLFYSFFISLLVTVYATIKPKPPQTRIAVKNPATTPNPNAIKNMPHFTRESCEHSPLKIPAFIPFSTNANLSLVRVVQ